MPQNSPFILSADTEVAGYKLVAFDTLNGSTNTEAMQIGRDGEVGPLWVVTDHQLGGRGRHSRSWIGGKGDLAASLLMKTDVPVTTLSMLGFVAGVALIQAINKLAPYLQNRVKLKWPNDILADGAKLSGILLESEAIDAKSRLVVVGIGVNVVSKPEGLQYPVISLCSLGADLSAQDIFKALADEWSSCVKIWDDGCGFELIRTLWLKYAAGIGMPIHVQLSDNMISGKFETIDEIGRLILRCADGQAVAIAAGDVHFGSVTMVRKD